jgi:hypothetical protein
MTGSSDRVVRRDRASVSETTLKMHWQEIKMKRTTLFGSVAAGLMAAAVAGPAWAQATTYPEGTDCAAISNSASRTECMNQMNESRQNPTSGAPGETAPGTEVAPGSADEPTGGLQNAPTGAPGDTNAPGSPTDNSSGAPGDNGTTQ